MLVTGPEGQQKFADLEMSPQLTGNATRKLSNIVKYTILSTYIGNYDTS